MNKDKNNKPTIDEEDDFADVLEAWGHYKDYLKTLDNADYEVNKPQMDALFRIYDFFVKALDGKSGKVDMPVPVPKELHAGLDVYCRVFYIYGDNINEFCNVMRGASAVSIDSLVDGTVDISITVPNVYKRKNGR